jgi:UDP-N-acetylglucosamine 2-epimerase (non-hydrolysing)
MKGCKICLVFGTRPEGIKLAPVIKEIEKRIGVESLVVNTGQHREMLAHVLELFKISSHYDLELMTKNQTLPDLTAKAISLLSEIFRKEAVDVVVVQGDTTTAFSAALAAFYLKIPVAHVEAGLRTFDKYSPFPEEVNRKLIAGIADWHFAPTVYSYDNLVREGIPNSSISMVGNTIVDAMYYILEHTCTSEKFVHPLHQQPIDVLLTVHRRESFGEPLRNIFRAVRRIAERHHNVRFIYPVHMNPSVSECAREMLGDVPNVQMVDPLSYSELVHVMDPLHYREMSKSRSLYGDGRASERIVDIILSSQRGSEERLKVSPADFQVDLGVSVMSPVL